MRTFLLLGLLGGALATVGYGYYSAHQPYVQPEAPIPYGKIAKAECVREVSQAQSDQEECHDAEVARKEARA